MTPEPPILDRYIEITTGITGDHVASGKIVGCLPNQGKALLEKHQRNLVDSRSIQRLGTLSTALTMAKPATAACPACGATSSDGCPPCRPRRRQHLPQHPRRPH